MTPDVSLCVCSPVGYESKSQVNSARATNKKEKKSPCLMKIYRGQQKNSTTTNAHSNTLLIIIFKENNDIIIILFSGQRQNYERKK